MDAKPIGKYEGREEIYGFWNTFVNSTHAADLAYTDIVIEEELAMMLIGVDGAFHHH